MTLFIVSIIIIAISTLLKRGGNMSEKEQLINLVDATISWSAELSEKYTNTLIEGVIDLQQSQVIKAVEQNDIRKIQTSVFVLAETLANIEKEEGVL